METDDLATNLARLRATFESDAGLKTWLTAPHDLLEGMSPLDLLAAGRGRELNEFIKDALSGQAT